MLRVHGVVRVRWVVVVMVEEFGRGERLAGVVRAGGINRDGRALGGVELGAHLVVQPAEHRAVPHPEVIALGQWDRASGAREATHVEHQVSGPHHQLRGEDRRVAAGASLHAAEHPIIVLLAVNVSVPAETGDFAVEALTAVGALKAGRVPPPVHRLKVKPVGYPEAASGANHPRHIVGLRGWGGRRLQFRDSVQVFGGLLLLRVSLRVQMRVMVVMVVVGRLRGHAQVAWVLEVAAVPVLLPTSRGIVVSRVVGGSGSVVAIIVGSAVGLM